MPDPYPTGPEFQAHVSARGYGAVTSDEATRLVGVAIRRWESAVGAEPYLGANATRRYRFPSESTEDGFQLDLGSLPVLSVLTIRIGDRLGVWKRTLSEPTDYLRLPMNTLVTTSLQLSCESAAFVEIEGMFGLATTIAADVYDAVLCMASLLHLENSQGPNGSLRRVQQGTVSVEYNSVGTWERLRARFDEVARARRVI